MADKYTVINEFADILDHGHVYKSGDEYPRKGYEPNDKRIAELKSHTNRLCKPLIAKSDGSGRKKARKTPAKQEKIAEE